MRSTTTVLTAAVLIGVVASGCSSPDEEERKYTGWGHYTWPDGVSLEITGARPCRPSATAWPSGVKLGAIVSIKVTNASAVPYHTRDIGLGDEQIKNASRPLLDPDGPCNTQSPPTKSIAPGKKLTFETAYTVPDSSGKMLIVLSTVPDGRTASFTGTVPVTHGA